jgi:hypothetical protein
MEITTQNLGKTEMRVVRNTSGDSKRLLLRILQKYMRDGWLLHYIPKVPQEDPRSKGARGNKTT